MNDMLQNTLAEILKQLANFFGVTTETIVQNAPQWLAKYGWYEAIGIFSIASIFGIPVATIIAIMFLFFLDECCDQQMNDKQNILVITICCLIVEFVIIGNTLIKCAVSPEMYGLVHLLEKIGG